MKRILAIALVLIIGICSTAWAANEFPYMDVVEMMVILNNICYSDFEDADVLDQLTIQFDPDSSGIYESQYSYMFYDRHSNMSHSFAGTYSSVPGVETISIYINNPSVERNLIAACNIVGYLSLHLLNQSSADVYASIVDIIYRLSDTPGAVEETIPIALGVTYTFEKLDADSCYMRITFTQPVTMDLLSDIIDANF